MVEGRAGKPGVKKMETAFVVGSFSSPKTIVAGTCKRNVVMKAPGGGPGGGRGGRLWKVGGTRGRSFFGGGVGKGNSSNAGGDGLSGNGGARSGDGTGDAGAGSESNPLVALWTAYNELLSSKPLLTKALTSLVGFGLGDYLAQNFVEKKGTFDKARFLRMAAFGFLFHGPTGHYFYGALDRLIVGTSPLKVASKVFIDQVLWAPIFTLCFFSILGLMEGKSVDAIKAKVQNDLWTGVTTSWKVWPVVHAINFRFIPTAQRLLYINSIQIGYNIFLSLLGNSDEEEEKAVPGE